MKTNLYRHFDENGALLYVGISLSAVQRLIQHEKSDWFDEISNVTIESFATRELALLAEKEAIKKELPIHNKMFSETYKKPIYQIKKNQDYQGHKKTKSNRLVSLIEFSKELNRLKFDGGLIALTESNKKKFCEKLGINEDSMYRTLAECVRFGIVNRECQNVYKMSVVYE